MKERKRELRGKYTETSGALSTHDGAGAAAQVDSHLFKILLSWAKRLPLRGHTTCRRRSLASATCSLDPSEAVRAQGPATFVRSSWGLFYGSGKAILLISGDS